MSEQYKWYDRIQNMQPSYDDAKRFLEDGGIDILLESADLAVQRKVNDGCEVISPPRIIGLRIGTHDSTWYVEMTRLVIVRDL